MRADDTTIRVFIYGSLLPGLANHHIIADHMRIIGDGCVHGILVDCHGLYPALVLYEEQRGGKTEPVVVKGLWIETTPEGLQAMDELEDYRGPGLRNDYERFWLNDLHDSSLAGWCYVWTDTRGYPVVPGGCWRTYLADRSQPRS